MQKAAFIHVFKTGGTSVYNWINQYYPRIIASPGADEFGQMVLDEPENIRSHGLIFGHVYAEDALRFGDTHRTLTIVRRPEEHLMSVLWHLYVNAESPDSHRLDTFDRHPLPTLLEMAKGLAPTGGGMQSLTFAPGNIDMDNPRQRRAKIDAALEVLGRVDVVGLTERMPETLALFARALGVDPPPDHEIPHARDAGAGRHGLPREIRRVLKHHLEIDRAIYRVALRRFRASVEQPRWRRSLWPVTALPVLRRGN